MRLYLIKCIHKGVAGMKTAQQIIGLPVVSIIDGNEIGKVKNVIVNSSKGTIDFFVIDSGVRSLSGGVIPADRVLGIGEYALTILQPDDISDIVKIPAAIELMQKNITVRGTRVLTKKGSLLGETGDIIVNEQDAYNITGVEFIPTDPSTKAGIIPRSSIITFGKDLLVVQDDFVDQLIEASNTIDVLADEKKNNIFETKLTVGGYTVTPQELDQGTRADTQPQMIQELVEDEEPEIITIQAPVIETQDQVSDKQEEAVKTPGDITDIDGGIDKDLEISFESNEEQMPNVETEAEAEIAAGTFESSTTNDTATEQPSTPANLFEQRQKQFLVGKKVTKTIYDTEGGVIIDSGEFITEDIIEKVSDNGKIIELVMNYEE